MLTRGLHSLVTVRQPLYLISTRHVPPTYFGAVPPRRLTEDEDCSLTEDGPPVSTVFAFNDRDLATDIALGLEHHHATCGVYPDLDSEDLDLMAPISGGVLRELDIKEASVPEVLEMVNGSGLSLSIMYRDSICGTPATDDSGYDGGGDDDGGYDDGGDDESFATCRSVDVRSPRGIDRSWLESVYGMCALLPKPQIPAERDAVTNPVKNRADDFFLRMLVAMWVMLASVVI